jgi:predicted S18 family serine protease
MYRLVLGLGYALLIGALGSPLEALAKQEQLIPILGTTTEKTSTGSVAYVKATFDERKDRNGLIVLFHTQPGRFSRMAQTSTEQAIRRTARSLGLSTDSWTVELSVPYEGITIYGDSLSAMVGMSVAAMAQGKTVPAGYVLTGTVTADGEIGPVGSVPLKIQAAKAAELRRVFVPNQKATVERDWPTPSTMEVLPVRSVSDAYEALTNSSPSK